MVLYNNYCSSDYGSGSSSSSWMSQQDIRWPSYQAKQTMERPNQKSSSYADLVTGRCNLEDVMREFQMNGSDSPYNPDEDRTWGKQTAYSELSLSGLGPSSAYIRQMSWPAPDRSPAPRLRRPEPLDFATSTPVFDEAPASFTPAPLVMPEYFMPEQTPLMPEQTRLTPEQTRVLNSLPAAVLHSLLRQLHTEKRTKLFQECRFCKNNGEREVYYRSHVLKDAAGRVACPVLRAFQCARCGARGDSAHTIKYCPLSTNEERIKSTCMMRSVRMASGRRRGAGPLAPRHAPLDPLWAALEQKLML